jgi:hypothetical protein
MCSRVIKGSSPVKPNQRGAWREAIDLTEVFADLLLTKRDGTSGMSPFHPSLATRIQR